LKTYFSDTPAGRLATLITSFREHAILQCSRGPRYKIRRGAVIKDFWNLQLGV
jgi:hypothetical protein